MRRVKGLCSAPIDESAQHIGLMPIHLGTDVRMALAQTLSVRRAIAVEAVPIRVFSSHSREELFEIFDSREVKLFTTSMV